MGALAILFLDNMVVWAAITPRSPKPAAPVENLATAVHEPRSDSDFLSEASVTFAPEKQDRVFYPYSVIPGGARNVAELKEAIAHDTSVAEHYADFNLSKTRVITLTAARAVYVSYRVGDGIFWTKNRLNLAAGESVLTDGEHMARTRCGNRISAAPVQLSSKAEPAPEAMEVPADSVLLARLDSPVELSLAPAPPTDISVPPTGPGSLYVPPFVPVFPVGNAFPPGSPAGPPPTPTPPGGPTPIPPGSPMPTPTPPGSPTPTPPPAGPVPPLPPGTPSPTPPGTPSTPPPGTPPPTTVPEPGTLIMLAAGFFSVLLLKRKIATR